VIEVLQPALTDIHNHLLPAVDDGAQSFEEAIRHLRILRAEGVASLAVSPHLFGWLTDEPEAFLQRYQALEHAFEEFAAACQARTDLPQLYFGQEILCQSPDIARRVFEHAEPGYRGTRYALVEFGFELKEDPVAIIRAVLASGRRMIVSHPERYRRNRVAVEFAELQAWKDAGAVLQLNVGSVFGDYGPGAQQLAWQAIEHGLADLISTDHHADQRTASPRAAYARLALRAHADVATRLMSENTARVLADEDLLPVPSVALR
jgi:protein-tyrosine phosphatase